MDNDTLDDIAWRLERIDTSDQALTNSEVVIFLTKLTEAVLELQRDRYSVKQSVKI